MCVYISLKKALALSCLSPKTIGYLVASCLDNTAGCNILDEDIFGNGIILWRRNSERMPCNDRLQGLSERVISNYAQKDIIPFLD